MPIQLKDLPEVYEQSLKNYHMLMSRRVKDILIVASLYDACIINQNERLADRLAARYRRRGDVRAPVVTWVHSMRDALALLEERDFDLVITTLQVADAAAADLATAVKDRWDRLPVHLLVHEPRAIRHLRQGRYSPGGVDQVFVWSPTADPVMTMIQCAEDMLNVHQDTLRCGVPVILLVCSAVAQASTVVPRLYDALEAQTTLSLQDGRDDEVRQLLGRARPRVVVVNDLASASAAVKTHGNYLKAVICAVSEDLGLAPGDGSALDVFIQTARRLDDTLPILLLDTSGVWAEADGLPPDIDRHAGEGDPAGAIEGFLAKRLGFGPMRLRSPAGRVIATAHSLAQLEQQLDEVPDASLAMHLRRHDFTRWLYARGELLLASRLETLETGDDETGGPQSPRELLAELFRVRRINRLQEAIVDFDPQDFDAQKGFYRIGHGAMGGKARGLFFLASQLGPETDWPERFPQVDLRVPGALVVTTTVFDRFVEANGLQVRARTRMSDAEIARRFVTAPLPDEVIANLEAYLAKVDQPLAVRSSSLLEDSLSRPYAGIYKTYMLPNDHDEPAVRLDELMTAIKLVYASTFFKEPRAFAARTRQKPDEEKMAVVIQGLVGRPHDGCFLPAVSGVAQSYNYYPVAPMQPEDGVANIAVGLGKTVVDGGRALRFCPRYPQNLPQFSAVDDMLDSAQRYYWALRMQASPLDLGIDADATLVRCEIGEDDPPDIIRLGASTYLPEEHRIKDASVAGGYPVMTFAPLLKYDALPLAAMLEALLTAGQEGLGRAVDIEFCVHYPDGLDGRPRLSILQIRPMAGRSETEAVAIQADERKHAFCYSENALGNGMLTDLADIVYVKPTDFDPAKTPAIAKEIAQMNAELSHAGRRYLLIGPGRWGSTDPWLGIPVNWADISGAAAIVETTHEAFNVDPSQGSHFFHNLTSLGMSYLNITAHGEDFIQPGWFASHPVMRVTRFLSHIRLERPVVVKVDGRRSCGIIRDSRS